VYMYYKLIERRGDDVLYIEIEEGKGEGDY
jgi:hypothetical protein